MGSGTTGVACLNTNRKFIGIEKKELPKTRPLTPELRAEYRENLVRRIWAPDLRKDLADRIVALHESGVYSSEINSAIRDAEAKVEQFKASGGAKGINAVWKSLGAWCKQKYLDAGVEWVKCSPTLEEKPKPEAKTVYVNYKNEQGYDVSFATKSLNEEQAKSLTHDLYLEDKNHTSEEIKNRIACYA